MFRIRPQGIKELQNQLSDGLEAIDDELLSRTQATAPVLTGAAKGSLQTNKEHSREWPEPAVFVSTSSGDGFFIHEGTSDTPAQPWMSQALDGMRSEIPSIMARRSRRR